MKLNDLKSGWQNAGGAIKSEADLLTMTRISNLSSVKRIRKKLIVETIFFSLFLVVYYDWFDGDQKPYYANALLISGLVLYIINDVIGFNSISRPIDGLNLKSSITNYLARVKRLAIYSLVISILYSTFLIIFFTSVINFTKEKSFLLAGIIVILFQMILWSNRIWQRWIKKLEQQMHDLNIDMEK